VMAQPSPWTPAALLILSDRFRSDGTAIKTTPEAWTIPGEQYLRLVVCAPPYLLIAK
jgi:hypothetical protein